MTFLGRNNLFFTLLFAKGMGKNVPIFTQLKQMPIRYALFFFFFFISDHIKQNLQMHSIMDKPLIK